MAVHIILRIFKEIGIAIVILALLLFVGFMLFRSQMPFLNSDIPNAIEYKSLDMAQFSIEGNYENETDPTKIYEASNGSLRTLEQDRRIHTGAPNPFVSSKAEPDIPTEKVSIANSANNKEGDNSSAEASTGENAEQGTEATTETAPVTDAGNTSEGSQAPAENLWKANLRVLCE